MTVTVTGTVETYVLVASHMDLVTPALNVVFSHQLDGVEVNKVPLVVSGAAFLAIFGNPAPDTTTPLAAILSRAIYNAGVTAGLFTGTVTADV